MVGARGTVRCLVFLLPAVVIQAPVAGWARAADGATEPSGRAEITIVADAPCAPRLRDVIVGQLADLTTELVWGCRERIDPDDAFRTAAPGASALRVWIDLRVGAEARLTLGDERSDRFVVRRIPLANGMDELGREQIGQIVRFAALAVRTGEGETLTRTQARAAVADWPAPRVRPVETVRSEAPAPPRAPPPAVDIGALWSLTAFSLEVPLVQELALGAAVGRTASPLWGWVEAGYRLPVSYRAEPIGVDLNAASLRFGLAAGQRGTRLVSFSVGAGIGVDRVSFAPTDAAASVQPAGDDTFYNVVGRLRLAVGLRATASLTIAARLACDLAAADVHYDLRDASGAARRVLTQFRLAPGLGLGLTWRL